MGTKSLRARLNLPTLGSGFDSTRKIFDDIMTEVKGSETLPDGERTQLQSDVGGWIVKLMKPTSDKDQDKQTRLDAEKAGKEILKKLEESKKMRGGAFDTIHKAQSKSSIPKLLEELRNNGGDASQIREFAEYAKLSSEAANGVWNAKSSEDAKSAAETFVGKLSDLEKRVAKRKTEIQGQIGNAKKYSASLANITELLTKSLSLLDEYELSIDPSDQTDTTKRYEALRSEYGRLAKIYLYGAVDKQPGQGDPQKLIAAVSSAGQGETEAKALFDKATKLASEGRSDSEKTIRPLKDRYRNLLKDFEKLEQEKQQVPSALEGSGFEFQLPYFGLTSFLKTIEGKFTVAERFFESTPPKTSEECGKEMLDELEQLLKEARAYTKKDEDEYVNAALQLGELTKRKGWIFATDLKNYLPQEADVMRAQYHSLEKDCEKKKPTEIKAYALQLVDVATKSNERVDRLKKRKVEVEKELSNHTKELETITKIVKKSDWNGKHKTFHGDYRRKIDELSEALKMSNGYDESKIEALLVALTELQETLKGGKTDGSYDHGELEKSHAAGLEEEANAEKEKQDLKTLQKKLETQYGVVKDVVAKADPGDSSELSSIRRELDELKVAVKGVPSKDAIDRYSPVGKRLARLQKTPGGAAVHARGQLDGVGKRFEQAVSTGVSHLSGIANKITSDYDGDNKTPVEGVVLAAATALGNPKDRMQKVINTFVTQQKPEQQAIRIKAREEGLLVVREYRTMLESNPVLQKLTEADPFEGGDQLKALLSALNDAELNLLRGI